MQPSSTARLGGAGMLALVATYGIGRQAFGLFVPAFRDEFGLGLDTLGFIAGAAQVGYLVATVVTGLLTVRLGPRIPVVVGCLVLAAGAATVAVAPGPAVLAIGVVAAGTSAGGAWGPFSDAVEVQVPEAGERRALALVNAGAPAGLILASTFVLLAGGAWRVVWWLFAAVGVAAAAVNLRVVTRETPRPSSLPSWPGVRWFLGARSVRLFVVTFGAAVTSGAYFAYAPDAAQAAGLPVWSSPVMWAVLGVAGSGVGVAGGGIADRYGLAWPLTVALLLLASSTAAMLAFGSLAPALLSAAVFGIGFTAGFAFLVMWNQEVFREDPTSGFTVTIVCLAAGFALGPALFGVLATSVGRPTAVVALAAPSLLVATVPLLRRPGRSPRRRAPAR